MKTLLFIAALSLSANLFATEMPERCKDMVGDRYQNRYDRFLNKQIKNKTIFVGSSSVANWKKIPTYFPELSDGWKGLFYKNKEGKRKVDWKLLKEGPRKNYENFGVGGTQICHLHVYLDRLFVNRQGGISPKRIVIYSGDNDLGNNYDAQGIVDNYSALIQRIREKGVTTPIYIISTKPSFKRLHQSHIIEDIGKRLEEQLDGKDDVTIINTFEEFFKTNGDLREDYFVSDGLHLTRRAYEMWAKYLRKSWNN